MRTTLLFLFSSLFLTVFAQNRSNDSYGAISFTKMSTFRNYYDLQTYGSPQQIWQDPSNYNNIHAVYTKSDAPGGTEFPNMSCYYFFSEDRGFSWVNLGRIDDARTEFGSITGLSNGNILIASTSNSRTVIYIGNFIGQLNFAKLIAPETKYRPRIIATDNVNNSNKFVFLNSRQIPDSTWLNVGTSLTQNSFLGYKQTESGQFEQFSLGRGADGRIGVAYITGSINNRTNVGNVYFMESYDHGSTFTIPLKIYQFNSDGDSLGAFHGISIVYKNNTPKIVFECPKIPHGFTFSGTIAPKIRFWSPDLPGTNPYKSIVIADSTKIPMGRGAEGGDLTPLCRPSLGISLDGSMIFCAFMAKDISQQNYYNIFVTRSSNGGVNWVNPERITPLNPRNDWTYVSVSPINDNDESNYFLNMTMQKDTIPGCFACGGSDYNTNPNPYFVRMGFTRLTTIPSAPVLVLPANNAINVPMLPTFTWNTTGLLHKLQISTNSGFTNIIYDKDSIVFNQFTMAVSALQSNTTYYWRVSARNDFGVSSYSMVFSFTVVNSNLPIAPVLFTPSNGALNVAQPVQLDWNDVLQAQSYRVQVSSFLDFHDEIYFDSSNITSSHVNINPLLFVNNIFYWRVNAKNSFGTSTYSAIFSFTTADFFPPVLTSPADSALTTINIALNWNAVQSADYYNYQISAYQDFHDLLYNNNSTSLGVMINNLPIHSKWYWRVRAVEDRLDDYYGPFSNIRSFTTAISPPTLVSPFNGQQGVLSNPTLKWNTVAGRTSYNFMISSNIIFTDTIYSNNSDTNFFNIPEEILHLNTTYYWKVRSRDSFGYGIYSSVWNFKVRVTGVQTISDVIPTEYKLFTNYPNPFNPTTKIKFDLPNSSIVRINVFDITGRMINEILNMNLNAGSYETEFNGANLSSGIYYYRIEAGNFVETKKMILIK